MPYGTPPGLRSFATENVAGPASAAANLFGSRCVAVGFQAGENAGTDPTRAADDNVFFGRNAGRQYQATEAVIIGSGALPGALPDGDADGVVAIGFNAYNALVQTHADGHIMAVGRRVLANYPGSTFHRNFLGIGPDVLAEFDSGSHSVQSCVWIGTEAGRWNNANCSDCTVIGFRAGGGAKGVVSGGPAASTIVGDGALQNAQAVAATVAIGDSVAVNQTVATSNVYIGSQAAEVVGDNSDQNIVIGQGTGRSHGDQNIIIGENIDGMGSGADRNVYVGQQIIPSLGDNNIAVGRAISSAHWNQISNVLELSTRAGTGGANPALGGIYADLDDGNMVLGMTVNVGGDPIDRDLGGGTNTLKLLNGTAPIANPTGGGFLYVTAGALNYRGSAGTITALALA